MGWSDWFQGASTCPVDPVTRDWIDGRWRWLEEHFGLARLREVEVVVPEARCFPDAFSGSEDDARRLLERVAGYMGVADEPIDLLFYDGSQVDPASYTEQGFGMAGSRGFYMQVDDVHQVWLEWLVQEPADVVATIAHELGHVILLGQGRITADYVDHEPLTDLLTVFLGLGVFTANTVVYEHNWRAGNASGWRMGRQGYLRMQDYGYAFARFARSRGEDGSAWAKHLRPDVRVRFQQAMRFLAAEEAAGRQAQGI